MYQPESFGMALLFMILSMICWGSWANTMKLTPRWQFQLFYWDYAMGVILASLIFGLTLGNTDRGPLSFFSNLAQADATHIAWALAGGVLFNVANLLLVAAIEMAGLAVAFPVGIGVAVAIAAPLNYLTAPKGNPTLLFGGVFLVLLAIVFNALAYRLRESQRHQVKTRGIAVSVISGLLMGTFYPFVTKATTGDHGLGPYTVSFVFAWGLVLCTIPLNWRLMRYPITGSAPLQLRHYADGQAVWHVLGVTGGLIWAAGTVLNFTASRAELVGPAVSYAIGQGGTMVSAAWGVFLWREFAGASAQIRNLLVLTFLFFALGLAAIAIAPIVRF
jgi:glucose uptake protein